MTLVLRKSADDEPPVLLLDGDALPPDAEVTWPAGVWAEFVYAYVEATAKTYAEAGVRFALNAANAYIQENFDAKAAIAPQDVPRPQQLTLPPLSIASMPPRVTRRKVIRDAQGRITEVIDVSEDVE